MWRIVSTERTTLQMPDVLGIFQGITERAIYTSCIILEVPEGIAAWLAFKAIQRVRIGEQTPDFKHVPGTAIYLIGNALSLAFGIAGGLIAIERFTLKF